MSARDEFYVGYLPDAPPTLAGWLRKRVLLLLVGVVAVAAGLVVSLSDYPRATFEFGEVRAFTGVVREDPYPMLLVERPGQPAGPDVPNRSSYYLVAFGKFGAHEAVAGLDGKRVELTGTLVWRDDQTMIELSDDPIRELGAGDVEPVVPELLGERTLVGEIVDSKCFLGVMQPGSTKPHRACATRCISGGIPPVLLVRDEAGNASYILLVDAEGRAVGPRVLEYVAEPVEVTGRLEQHGDLRVLFADPGAIRRLH